MARAAAITAGSSGPVGTSGWTEEDAQAEGLVHHEAGLVGRAEHLGQLGHQRPPRHAGRGLR